MWDFFRIHFSIIAVVAFDTTLSQTSQTTMSKMTDDTYDPMAPYGYIYIPYALKDTPGGRVQHNLFEIQRSRHKERPDLYPPPEVAFPEYIPLPPPVIPREADEYDEDYAPISYDEFEAPSPTPYMMTPPMVQFDDEAFVTLDFIAPGWTFKELRNQLMGGDTRV